MGTDDSELEKGTNAGRDRIRRLCPRIDQPVEECYFVRLDSQSVERAIYFCGNNFEDCSIYRRIGPGPDQ